MSAKFSALRHHLTEHDQVRESVSISQHVNHQQEELLENQSR